MHNPALAALGLDWRYLACDVHPDRLREAIMGAQAMKFIGLNLTIPHKLLAVDIVDVLDESVKTWGAVNTVRFEAKDASGAWQPLAKLNPEEIGEMRSVGFNTDADGLELALSEAFNIGKQGNLNPEWRGLGVVVLGTGGAGRVAALKMAQLGVAQLFLLNRTASKSAEHRDRIRDKYPGIPVEIECSAEQLKEHVEQRARSTTHVYSGAPFGRWSNLLINATSVGLKPDDPSPLEGTGLRVEGFDFVYDMIYSPAESPLLRSVREANRRMIGGEPIKAANGLGMLLYQGTKALEIWTGQPAPVELMRAALLRNVYGSA